MPQTRFVESILLYPFNISLELNDFNRFENDGTRITIQVNISANARRHWQHCWIFRYLCWLKALWIQVIEMMCVHTYFQLNNWSANRNKDNTIQQAISMPFSLLLWLFIHALWWSMTHTFTGFTFLLTQSRIVTLSFFFWSYFELWTWFAFRLLLISIHYFISFDFIFNRR